MQPVPQGIHKPTAIRADLIQLQDGGDQKKQRQADLAAEFQNPPGQFRGNQAAFVAFASVSASFVRKSLAMNYVFE
jgi:hypothetical protein